VDMVWGPSGPSENVLDNVRSLGLLVTLCREEAELPKGLRLNHGKIKFHPEGLGSDIL
jgi:hypothetical protein